MFQSFPSPKHVTFNNKTFTKTIPSRSEQLEESNALDVINSDFKENKSPTHNSSANSAVPNLSGAYADALNSFLEKFIIQTACRNLTERTMRDEWNRLIAGSGILPLDMTCLPQRRNKWSFMKSCRFICGPHYKNPGVACGKIRFNEHSGMICESDFAIEGRSYKGQWLCKRHIRTINNAANKQAQQCIAAVRNKKSQKLNQCPRRAVNKDNFCSVHIHRSSSFKEFLQWKDEVKHAANIPLPAEH